MHMKKKWYAEKLILKIIIMENNMSQSWNGIKIIKIVFHLTKDVNSKNRCAVATEHLQM